MANRKDFFFRQKVTEAELDEALDGLEDADRAFITDMGGEGIWFGLGITERGLGQNQSVDVAAGAAYDQTGQRMAVAALQNVDISVDHLGASTQVAGGGNQKLVGVYLKFARALSDPRVDGSSATVFFDRDESFEFVVRQGPEEAAPATTFPALQSDEILIGDIRRTFSDNTIANANIETTRRQVSWVEQVVDGFDSDEIAYAGGGNWADATTNPATTVELQLDKIVTDLASTTAGTAKIGGAAIAGASSTIPLGTLLSQLTALKSATNIDVPALSAWLGGRTNPAAALSTALEKIINDLAATTAADDGAERIGAAVSGNLAVGSVRSQLTELDTEKGGLGLTNTWTAANTFSGGGTISGVFTKSGTSGRVVDRFSAALGDADADLTVAFDIYLIPTNLAADRMWTLRHTGTVPSQGDRIRVIRAGGTNDARFQREDTTILAAITATFFGWIDFMYHTAGGWRTIGWGRDPGTEIVLVV